jgi:cobyrinic acid a,c-diamide synthase
MSGALPFATTVCSRPQGHGYVAATVTAPSPFFAPGTRLLGHEFHYSCCRDLPEGADLVLQLDPGVGMAAGRDGLVWRNVLASYTHIHAVGVPAWADAMVEAAMAFAACLSGEPLENLRRSA